MDLTDFARFVRNLTVEDITTDEPHVGMRCAENGISLSVIKHMLLNGHAHLLRITEDRSQVYKLYYRWSKGVELKVVIDTITRGKVNIRTVRRLDGRFPIPSMEFRIMIEGESEGEDLNTTKDWRELW